MSRRIVVPVLWRAGLGNELFTFLRAVDAARAEPSILLPPRWFQPRIGPTLRGERDRRQYWLLFRTAPLHLLLLREALTPLRAIASALHLDTGDRIVEVRGMGEQFADLRRAGTWYRERLTEFARPGVIGAHPAGPYVSVHVRLGDFAGATGGLDTALTGPNTAAPLEWYLHWVLALREARPDLPVLVSSDGTDAQLAPLLELPGVTRSDSPNALDELVLMSHAQALIGSRSTFSAWGAFLGDIPMLVPLGGDQYRPHDRVWEAGSQGGDAFLAAMGGARS